MRPSKRAFDEMRDIRLFRRYTYHAEGSVLVKFGETQVLCTASIERGVPIFLRGQGQGWITAEYGMLPRSTHTRTRREATQNKQTGRTLEIQRLIGRSLRTAVNRKRLGENTIIIDCDVIQADGGTRTAAITGAYVALVDAARHGIANGLFKEMPVCDQVASVSVGLYEKTVVLDLDYAEDSEAKTDMNVVMNVAGEFIEIQGTAEKEPFNEVELREMLSLAKKGITQLLALQSQHLNED